MAVEGRTAGIRRFANVSGLGLETRS
ncbi:hypothetical protein MTBSS4_260019 [Magnetospirillum sp. SS-4]|nr:hypothetical protein MTBSS4_260019 [Magnetospirillum sp. SS-4]